MAFKSRSELLLTNEVKSLIENPLQGIVVQVLGNKDVYHWTVNMSGLTRSVWQDAKLILRLSFDEYYDQRPPQVHFYTIPFHPNVDCNSGKVCLDALEDWSSKTSLRSLLLSVQCLLCCPNPHAFLNELAAQILLSNPEQYARLVEQSVFCSQQLEARLKFERQPSKVRIDPVSVDRHGAPKADLPERDRRTQVRLVAFDDYYVTWRALGTSLPDIPFHCAEARSANFSIDALQAAIRSGQPVPKRNAPKASKMSMLQRLEKMHSLYAKKPSEEDSAEAATATVTGAGTGAGTGTGAGAGTAKESSEPTRQTSKATLVRLPSTNDGRLNRPLTLTPQSVDGDAPALPNPHDLYDRRSGLPNSFGPPLPAGSSADGVGGARSPQTGRSSQSWRRRGRVLLMTSPTAADRVESADAAAVAEVAEDTERADEERVLSAMGAMGAMGTMGENVGGGGSSVVSGSGSGGGSNAHSAGRSPPLTVSASPDKDASLAAAATATIVSPPTLPVAADLDDAQMTEWLQSLDERASRLDH